MSRGTSTHSRLQLRSHESLSFVFFLEKQTNNESDRPLEPWGYAIASRKARGHIFIFYYKNLGCRRTISEGDVGPYNHVQAREVVLHTVTYHAFFHRP